MTAKNSTQRRAPATPDDLADVPLTGPVDRAAAAHLRASAVATLHAFVETQKGRQSYALDLIRGIVEEDGDSSLPDALFRTLVLDNGIGVMHARDLYHAARELVGE